LKFKDLGIAPDICEALERAGITDAFPIQQQCIPLALRGSDLIGQAQTGTGKTLGFGLPLIERVSKLGGIAALVLVPTRELAIQVAADLTQAASGRDTKIACIYGGKSYEGQLAEIKAGANVVVGTPGRVLDLMNQGELSLKQVSVLVLDEADRMLDLGFLPDVEKILSRTPSERQTMLFSATMPDAILTLGRRYLNQPVHIRVSDPNEAKTKAAIKQFVYRTHSLDKDELLGRILQARGRGKTVVFTRTKIQASKLTDELIARGFQSTALHGDMSQEARERSLQAFRSGKRDVLVATEVAARGLDIEDVSHVVNFSVPEDEKGYLHRTGRTGRAGNLGIAVTFVDWADLHRWQLIDKALELGIPEPAETYSNSPHIFEDLDIPEGTIGRLKPAASAPAKPSEKTRRAKTGSSPERNTPVSSPAKNRNRRRNYRGSKGSTTPEA
jgi:superfamily II DNA/RNA helicase